MSTADPLAARVPLAAPTPTLARGALNSRGQPGWLLIAPHQETLAWDLDNQIASTGREWMDEQGGWWISNSYFQTAVDAVLRSFPSLLVLDPPDERLISREDAG